jgi:hypothetical protein
LILLFLSGCRPIKPTYTKEKIVESITSLCQQEYNIEPKVWLLGETVWIYIPLPRLLNEEIQFDKTMAEKINKVIMGASRVVLSMKPRPQFMVVTASDTKEYGIDYNIISWIPDIVKFQLQFISRDEFHKRTVTIVERNNRALLDVEGEHIEKKEIQLADFLAEQIAQRIAVQFQKEDLKKYFKIDVFTGKFKNDRFIFEYSISEVLKPDKKINIIKEILGAISYCIKTYEFKDFSYVEIRNLLSEDKLILDKGEVCKGSIL